MIVLVPTYGKPEQVTKCKEALFKQTVRPTRVEYREDTQSEGFTKNVNHLIKANVHTHGDFMVILNQDCYLAPNALEVFEKFMVEHPKCAIAGVKQVASANPDLIIHGGTKECYPAGRHEGGKVSEGDCSENKRVPWVNGACMVVRKSAVVDIGLLDSTMVMFGSDADWSLTARARGWETWYIADTFAVHEQGISQGSSGLNMDKQFRYDMLAFRSKWLDGEFYRDMSLEIF